MGMNGETPEERQRSITRLESEIREILEKSDRQPSNVIKFKSRVRQNRYSAADSFHKRLDRAWLTDLNMLIAAVVLAVAGYFASDSAPIVARICAVASIGTIVWIFVRYFRRPDQAGVKQWRGRDIDFGPPRRPDWIDRRFGGPKRPKR
jgi:hypothetical protein